MRRFHAVLLLLSLSAWSGAAHAWNAHGHRLVARLAEPQLGADAHAEVRRLLALEGATSMADVASWADDLRGTGSELGRRSGSWHFVNMAQDGCAYDAARHCQDEGCVVAAIRDQAATLGDRRLPDSERLQALKFIIHFVGDAHQPMHAGHRHDRGGNRVQVQVLGKGSNLHAVWDGDLLASAGLDEAGYVDRLRQAPGQPGPDAGPYTPSAPAVWVEQSCRIATTPGVYPASAKLDATYFETYRPAAEHQLQLAGARLARLLNDVLPGSTIAPGGAP